MKWTGTARWEAQKDTGSRKNNLQHAERMVRNMREINRLISRYNQNAGNASRIKYIVIHYTGAMGDAKANCNYFAGGNRNASAHYFVGYGGDIWQSVEDKNVAWHCGASSYKHAECRNSNSIGIEMCVRKKNTASMDGTDKDWYFEDATVEAAAELTRHLMDKYGVPASRVIRHYDVTGKICPNPYVYNNTAHTWDEFKRMVSGGASEGSSSQEQEKTQAAAGGAFKVKVEISDLNIRTGPGTNYARAGKYTGKGIFTITETKEGKGSAKGWGKLKSNAGWISLDYATRL